MVGEELLALQGIPSDDLLLTKETEDQLKDLAGEPFQVSSWSWHFRSLMRAFIFPLCFLVQVTQCRPRSWASVPSALCWWDMHPSRIGTAIIVRVVV
jgi:hypothetical protein